MGIQISKLRKKDKGRLVIYKQGTPQMEEGIIKTWNKTYIFVLYKGDYSSKATYPRDLTFASKEQKNDE